MESEPILSRTLWWIGTRLGRLEGAHPALYLALLFSTAWVASTLLAHFSHLYAGENQWGHLPWGTATAAGFGLACLATITAYVLRWLRDR